MSTTLQRPPVTSLAEFHTEVMHRAKENGYRVPRRHVPSALLAGCITVLAITFTPLGNITVAQAIEILASL